VRYLLQILLNITRSAVTNTYFTKHRILVFVRVHLVNGFLEFF